MSIWTIVVAVLAACGIWWAYPKLPQPGQIVLVVVVVIVCLLILLSLAGVPTGIHL